METLEAKQLLKNLGVSSTVITVSVVVLLIAYLYKTYLDADLTTLQIKKLKRDLSIT